MTIDKYGKRIKVKMSVLVHILILTILSNPMLNWACFCGNVCSHSLNNPKSTNVTLHNRCLGVQCKTCNFEDLNSIKAFNGHLSISKSNNYHLFLCIIDNLISQRFYYYKNCVLCALHLKVSSSPTYLKCLHLLL